MKTLRECRTDRVMSVRDLAEQAGVSTKTIVQLEYGRQRAQYKSMRAVAQALGVEVGEIAEFAEVLEQRRAERRGRGAEGGEG